MPGVHTGRSATANGSIVPYGAVQIDTSTNNRLIQATSASKAIGIAQKGTRYAPWSPLDDGFCAIANEVFEYYGAGEENVPALLGGTVTAGDYLTVGSGTGALAGSLVTSPGGADDVYVIGIARMSGVSGEIIPIDVQIFEDVTS
jgi:hypothetical protein